MCKIWEVEVEFIDGTKVKIQVEADTEEDAYINALPTSYRANKKED